MIYVEFFDRTSIENVCSCLAARPERVFFVGRDKRHMDEYAKRYSQVLHRRGIHTTFVLYATGKNNLHHQVDVLSKIVEEQEACVFDLTGGDDLSLVATGIVYEKYRHQKNIGMQWTNFRRNMVFVHTLDGVDKEMPLPELSVEENIQLYGGDVMYVADGYANGTFLWEDSKEFFFDIDALWHVSARHVKGWARQISKLALAEKHGKKTGTDGLMTTLNIQAGIDFFVDSDILNALAEKKLICYTYDRKTFSIQYKNEQIKKCLTKEGLALEMKVYATAKQTGIFGDALNGVVIDWNGECSENGNTTNEIDVCLMHHAIPIFISCKCGDVSAEELFKLKVVAERFGGEHAKKVLVMNRLPEECYFQEYFLRRAEDLGVQIIHDAHTLTNEEFFKKIKDIV